LPFIETVEEDDPEGKENETHEEYAAGGESAWRRPRERWMIGFHLRDGGVAGGTWGVLLVRGGLAGGPTSNSKRQKSKVKRSGRWRGSNRGFTHPGSEIARRKEYQQS
jgi:hypothetical protein